MVFRGPDITFSKVSSVVFGSYELYYTRGSTVTEELAYRFGRLVVRDEVGDGVVM